MFNCFDVSRMRLQIQDGLGQPGKYRSLSHCLRTIVAEEGALGPWRPGLGAAVFRELFYGGFQFGACGSSDGPPPSHLAPLSDADRCCHQTARSREPSAATTAWGRSWPPVAARAPSPPCAAAPPTWSRSGYSARAAAATRRRACSRPAYTKGSTRRSRTASTPCGLSGRPKASEDSASDCFRPCARVCRLANHQEKKHWTSDMGVGPTVIRAVFLTVGLLVSCETASSNNTVACSICPR